MFDGTHGVGLEVKPRLRQLGWEPDMDEKVVCELVVEAVEELVVVNGQHAPVETVEERVLQV